MDPLPEEAIHHERHVRIVCIGAGASGLLLAYKLQKAFRNFSLTIYDKNDGISGTWLENIYPGCACDVPAHNYTYSFEPKSDWSTAYASSSEIKGYFESFATKYELYKYIKLRHRVSSAVWSKVEGLWDITTYDMDAGSMIREQADILIKATGYLNDWTWPDIPGVDSFQGELVHSAHWNPKTVLKDKNVILIGNGSSALQILPAIQPTVKSATTFIRSPQWILPTISSDQQQGYTQSQIDGYRDNPQSLLHQRKMNEVVMNSIFSVYISNSKLQAISQNDLTMYMKSVIRNGEIEEKLIPKWGIGCRRLSPGQPYLEALFKENVHRVYSGVEAFTPEGCRGSDGKDYAADVIICATGYDTSFVPRFSIIGENERNLQDVWSKKPSSYLGIAASGFPNMFMFLGPYSPVANGPTLAGVETQADHILAFIDRYQTENIHSMAVKPEAEADFEAQVATFMKGAVYSEGCRSGHKNHTTDGRVPTLWPGSTLHYKEALREVRFDDWEITYEGNRFAWLGNGVSQAEFDPTSDLAWYVRARDDGPPASRRGRRELYTRTGSQVARELHRVHRPSTYNI